MAQVVPSHRFPPNRVWVGWALFVLSVGLFLGCPRTPPKTARTSGAGWHDVYVWQLKHTPSVVDAVQTLQKPSEATEAVSRLRRVLLLGTEIKVKGCELRRSNANYKATTLGAQSVGLVVRLGPLRLDRCSQAVQDAAMAHIGDALTRALDTGLRVAELQLDFDAPTRVLGLYAHFLQALRLRVLTLAAGRGPIPLLSITALPTWLDSAVFADVASSVDTYTLQVHGLEAPDSLSAARSRGDRLLFDTEAAKAAVSRAEDLGQPFDVSIPTYGYELGFKGQRFIGLRADAPAIAWPAGTSRVVVGADPQVVAAFVQQLRLQRPSNLGVIRWFRQPVGDERLNWDRQTFDTVRMGEAVVTGLERSVRPALQGRRRDIWLTNTGNVAQEMPAVVDGASGFAADGMTGYEALRNGPAWRFQRRPNATERRWLRPGQSVQVGWCVDGPEPSKPGP